jgi:hypothetical protein
VFFSNGGSAVFPLTQLQNQNAHYQGDVPAGAEVIGAQAVIYAGWSGSFVLSHYLCGTTPPTTSPPTTAPPTTPPPTTAPPTTVAPTTVAPTTVAPTTAPPTTAKQSPGHSTTTVTPGNDASTTTLATATSSAAAPASGQKLAFTGSRSADLAWLGLALIGVGLLLTAGRRRGGSQDPDSDN